MADVEAPFTSVSEARSAYFGDSSSSGGSSGGDGADTVGGGDGEEQWGTPTTIDTLPGGWDLVSQQLVDGSRTRYFVLRVNAGVVETINSAGVVYERKDTDTDSDLPHFDDEQDARDAHAKWLSGENTETVNTETEWGEWQKLRNVAPWWIWARSHTDGERAQFLVSGVLDDGTAVYLGPRGDVETTPHLFESVDGLNSALEAYFTKVENGDIPEDMQPNGSAPTKEQITEAVTNNSTSSFGESSSSEIIEKLGGQKVVLAAVGVAGLVALRGAKK